MSRGACPPCRERHPSWPAAAHPGEMCQSENKIRPKSSPKIKQRKCTGRCNILRACTFAPWLPRPGAWNQEGASLPLCCSSPPFVRPLPLSQSSAAKRSTRRHNAGARHGHSHAARIVILRFFLRPRGKDCSEVHRRNKVTSRESAGDTQGPRHTSYGG